MAMESVSEAVRRLTAAGYTDDYRADAQGLRTYTVAFGPLMDALDADMVRRLPTPGTRC